LCDWGRDKQGKGFSHLIRKFKKYYTTGEIDIINIKGRDMDIDFHALGGKYRNARKDYLDGLNIEMDIIRE
jgi:hypothetical protein